MSAVTEGAWANLSGTSRPKVSKRQVFCKAHSNSIALLWRTSTAAVANSPPNGHLHANTAKMSLVSGEKSNFQYILRLLNTNVRIPPPCEFRATEHHVQSRTRRQNIRDEDMD